MIFLLVLADDFTGALDTAVQFVKQGIKTEVLTVKDLDFSSYNTDVLVIDTETRHLCAQDAFTTINDLVKKAKEAGVKYIYKKTDSALRGNIGSELEATIQGFEGNALAFMPAFPQMNRTTENGIHYIDGVEVHKSHFGKDPYEPVKTSSVKEIIASQSTITVSNIKDVNKSTALNYDGIMVFDAKTEDDLITCGQKIVSDAKTNLLAGCAGFAEFLPKLLNIKPTLKTTQPKLATKFLTICGSVNPITLLQLKCAQDNGFERISLLPHEKLQASFKDAKDSSKLLESLKEQIIKNRLLIIESNDVGDSTNAPTANYAKEHGLTTADVRERISWTMGHIAKSALDLDVDITLLLTGGDTLLKCMKCANVSTLKPICEIEKGVVLASFDYKDKKVNVITKSGGFGSEDLLVKIARTLESVKD